MESQPGICLTKIETMFPDVLITLITLVVIFIVLIYRKRAPDLTLWSGVVVLLLIPVYNDQYWSFGVLSPNDVLIGFANEGVITIAALFVVAAGLKESGVLLYLSQNLLGVPNSLLAAQQRIIWPTAFISAFMNNTPVVAIMMPTIDDWARRYNLSISKLLMPLSFASILGGACTLIGTSSNIIVNGWLINEYEHSGFGLFEISKVGIPLAVTGIVFILISNRWLLKDRTPVISVDDDARQYTIEMIVIPNGNLVDKTVMEAGLRGLRGLYLVEIARNGEVLSAVSSDFLLKANDQLIFAGVVESVVDLQKVSGLRPATDQIFKLNESRRNRHLIEAVVSNSCPLLGKTIREGRFRNNYNAAVIAVARNGERINKKIGDIILQAGDILLLDARSNFITQQRNKSDFYLVSKLETGEFINPRRAVRASLLLGLMVFSVSFGLLSMFMASFLAALLMILFRCCSADTARRSLDMETILVIVAALALGKAMDNSGLADTMGQWMYGIIGNRPSVMLSCVFIATMLIGNMITAKAGAVLMLPVVVAIAESLGVSMMPFIIAVMLASATSLATPIGYPTNLMVFGPGGYHFSDYLRLGLPLSIIIWIISSLMIPIFWSF